MDSKTFIQLEDAQPKGLGMYPEILVTYIGIVVITIKSKGAGDPNVSFCTIYSWRAPFETT